MPRPFYQNGFVENWELSAFDFSAEVKVCLMFSAV